MAEAVEKRGDPDKVVPPIAPRRPSGYNGRFLLAYLLVVVVFAGMIGVFAFLVSRSDSAARWSTYHPKGNDPFDKAQNLANYVAPRYVHGGDPIAVVQAEPLIYKDTVVDGIAFTRKPFRDVGSNYGRFERADSTMLYVFCGQALRCGLPEDGAEAVVSLLRRESLELALYTFKYWPDVDSIVTLMPPIKESSPAIYIKRTHLQRELSKPLEQTLPSRSEITIESMTDSEVARVVRLTANNIYPSSFQEVANGRMLLLLGTGNQ